MNKKAFLASYTVDFVSYLIFVFILLIFFISISFAALPIEPPLKIATAQADATGTLINMLNAQIGEIKTTPAQIIQNEDTEHIQQFQSTIRNSILSAYPPKERKEMAWLRVYTSEESQEHDFCTRNDWGKYFNKDDGLSYGKSHYETEPIF